jgi:lipid-binding SYLF domain-containing protein
MELHGRAIARRCYLTHHSRCLRRRFDRRPASRSSTARGANPAAAKCKSKAVAVLVFPDVIKAGFILGAQGGKGILFVHGRPNGRYRTVAASYGLQAGVQKYGYALFFMNQKAVDWINNTRGWEIGTGPSVVIVDKGMARSFTTDTLHSGIYAFTFHQQGLMAGLGLQGSKIMRD